MLTLTIGRFFFLGVDPTHLTNGAPAPERTISKSSIFFGPSSNEFAALNTDSLAANVPAKQTAGFDFDAQYLASSFENVRAKNFLLVFSAFSNLPISSRSIPTPHSNLIRPVGDHVLCTISSFEPTNRCGGSTANPRTPKG